MAESWPSWLSGVGFRCAESGEILRKSRTSRPRHRAGRDRDPHGPSSLTFSRLAGSSNARSLARASSVAFSATLPFSPVKNLAIIMTFIVALLAGCATAPKPIALQTKPTLYSATTTAKVSDIKIAVSDIRADRTLDPILEKSASDEVAGALRKALLDSKIALVSTDAKTAWDVQCKLTRLDWFVPGYKAMLRTAFATSFLTGGIGGLAYGSTSTPVQGNAVLQLRITESGKEVLNREYVGFHEEKVAKLKCDTMDTKSRVAGLALSDAIEKFLKDVDRPAVAASGHP